ncbi:MAG: FG-GAP repeat protein [Lachnospiraceae bacterium]|nr:FG-GAP repeat protein [Lachnospiraceae bacterium]
MQRAAQAVLDRFYPDEALMAVDMTAGDLNGDGMMDLAVTGLDETADQYDGGKKVYSFIRQADGNLRALNPIGILGSVYGEMRSGILITDGRLAVRAEDRGGNMCRKVTNIYQYEDGEMKEKWRVGLGGYDYYGDEFTITNMEDGSYRSYVIAQDNKEERQRLLLYEHSGGSFSPMEREFLDDYAKYQERRGIVLKEFPLDLGIGRMEISIDSYDYQIHNVPYDTKWTPDEVLLEAAEKYLRDYCGLPVPYYASDEIWENYKTLTGVEPPKFLWIGQDKKEPDKIKMLSYDSCEEQEDGSFQHKLSLWQVRYAEEEAEIWEDGKSIYFDERDERFYAE